jgi:DNA ligase-1
MRKAIETIIQINSINGSIDKENFLRANATEEMKYLLKLAFDPYITFGVKDFKLVLNSEPVPKLDTVKKLVEDILTGKVKGNQARDLIIERLSSEYSLANKYLEAIFKKNLTIGLATKSINLVIPGLIPTFDVGLCDKFDEKYFNSVKNWGIQPKYDGLRSICIVDKNGDSTFYSRNGKPQFNLDHIADEIKFVGFRNVVFDGEVLASNWNETASLVHSEKNTNGKNVKNTKFYIFDMMQKNEWEEKFTLPYFLRFDTLEKLNWPTFKYLIKVPTMVINSFEQANEEFTILLANRYEGAVLKNLDAPYPFKRTRDWMKLKNEETYDLVIKSYVEGEGRLEGKLGKFICDLNGVEIGVGGGFTDEQREVFWLNRNQMLGSTIEVKCQEKTKDGSLRFPIFLRLREDK